MKEKEKEHESKASPTINFFMFIIYASAIAIEIALYKLLGEEAITTHNSLEMIIIWLIGMVASLIIIFTIIAITNIIVSKIDESITTDKDMEKRLEKHRARIEQLEVELTDLYNKQVELNNLYNKQYDLLKQLDVNNSRGLDRAY